MYKRKDQAMTVCQKFLAIAPYKRVNFIVQIL